MKGNLNLAREELNTLRQHLLQKQLINAYKNIPFYQKFFREQRLHPREINCITGLSRLPIITKELIREDDTQFLNRHFPRTKYHISYSSGSTGEPFRSYFNSTSWLRKKYFSKFRARKECGLRFGEKIAIFETEALDKLQKKNNKLRFIPAPYRVQFFSVFEPLEETLQKVYQFDPQNFYGPPSYLFRLAGVQNQCVTKFKNLKRVFTASEYLAQNVHTYLEKSFQAPVYDHYGCTETKEVAWQCQERNGYHINEDEIICEILDGETVLPEGEVGDIVLTDLHNRAMPFIRYQIGDKGMLLKDPCPCGRSFKLMRPLAGRASEYIVLPDGEQLSPYLLTTAIEKTTGLLQYQIIQKNKNQLTVKVILKDRAQARVLVQIQEKVQKATQNKLEVDVEVCENLTIEENGKFKVVKNVMNQHDRGAV